MFYVTILCFSSLVLARCDSKQLLRQRSDGDIETQESWVAKQKRDVFSAIGIARAVTPRPYQSPEFGSKGWPDIYQQDKTDPWARNRRWRSRGGRRRERLSRKWKRKGMRGGRKGRINKNRKKGPRKGKSKNKGKSRRNGKKKGDVAKETQGAAAKEEMIDSTIETMEGASLVVN